MLIAKVLLNSPKPPTVIRQFRLDLRSINTIPDKFQPESKLITGSNTNYTSDLKPNLNAQKKARVEKTVLHSESESESGSKLKSKSKSKSKPKQNLKSKSQKKQEKIPKANFNALERYNDLRTYLDYSESKSLSVLSSVFQGNFYEFQVMSFLKNNFTISRLIYQGGKGDNGVDLRADWKPVETFHEIIHDSSFKNENKNVMATANNRKIKPILKKKVQDVKLFVQCKCYDTSRIGPKLLREITGTFTNFVKDSSNRSFFMIVSTNGFTKYGLIDFEKASVPLIYVTFSKSVIKNLKNNPYRLDSYNLGKFESFYCNPVAKALLKGLDWEMFCEKLVIDQKP